MFLDVPLLGSGSDNDYISVFFYRSVHTSIPRKFSDSEVYSLHVWKRRSICCGCGFNQPVLHYCYVEASVLTIIIHNIVN